jgi:uncharacterized protein (DUF2252 family)
MQALTDERNRKMSASAHAYVRGSTKKFYEWLARSDRPALPEGPSVWICGDCHVGNLGPIASKSGSLAIQIRDLDQTVIGNPVHDLIRLALSLAMAARSSDLPGVTTALMLERMMEGYGAAFAAPHLGDQFDDIGVVPDTVKLVMHEARRRSWKHLADERIEGVEPTLPLGQRFWPLTTEERLATEIMVKGEAFRRLATSLRSREDDAKVRLLDAAYWRKGCSSLGGLRLAALVRIGKGRNEEHCLIDIKEAVKASAPRAADVKMPSNNAERVVQGALHLSPHLGARMLATEVLGKSVFIRELLPQDLKLEVESLTREEALSVAEFLAYTVGLAHARQLNATERSSWLAELQRNRSKSLDAPSWLWNAVVDLVATHEAAYLEHCRRYALEQAAA